MYDYFPNLFILSFLLTQMSGSNSNHNTRDERKTPYFVIEPQKIAFRTRWHYNNFTQRLHNVILKLLVLPKNLVFFIQIFLGCSIYSNFQGQQIKLYSCNGTRNASHPKQQFTSNHIFYFILLANEIQALSHLPKHPAFGLKDIMKKKKTKQTEIHLQIECFKRIL